MNGGFLQASQFPAFIVLLQLPSFAGTFGFAADVVTQTERASSAVPLADSSVLTATNLQIVLERPVNDVRLGLQNIPVDLSVSNNGVAAALVGESQNIDFSMRLLDLDSLSAMLVAQNNLYAATDGRELFTVFDLGHFNERTDKLPPVDLSMLNSPGNGLLERGAAQTAPWVGPLPSEQERRNLYRLIDTFFSSPLAPVPAKQLWRAVQPSQSEATPKQTPPSQSSEEGSPPRPRESSGAKTPTSESTGSERQSTRRGSLKTGPQRLQQSSTVAQQTDAVRAARSMKLQRSN